MEECLPTAEPAGLIGTGSDEHLAADLELVSEAGTMVLDYLQAKEPDSQLQAIGRRKIGRRARSRTKRPILLAELEKRYGDSS